jgi:D-galactarolactone cycloisomerase
VWGTPIAIAAALQLIAVLPDNPPALYPSSPMLELDLTEHGVRDAMMVEALRPKNGIMTIPDGPGLGIEVDRNVVQSFIVS